MKKILLPAGIALFSIVFGWTAAFAQSTGLVGSDNPAQTDTANTSVTAPSASSFQIVSCNPTYNPATGQLDNPCGFEQLITTAYRIVKYLLYIIIPIMGAMLLFAGFKYMSAGGDANLVADAKRMFKPLLIGVFLIFGAWLIVYTILDKLLATQLGDVTKASIIGK